jgi:hypothetical protein
MKKAVFWDVVPIGPCSQCCGNLNPATFNVVYVVQRCGN